MCRGMDSALPELVDTISLRKGGCYNDDQVILVTGGTGSFGQKFIEIVLRDYHPQKFSDTSAGMS